MAQKPQHDTMMVAGRQEKVCFHKREIAGTTLPETNSSHRKNVCIPKGKYILPTINCQWFLMVFDC